MATIERLLSPNEQERASQLHHAYRRRYTVCRAALRQILAARVKDAPQSLTFIRGSHGKPQLMDGPSFNMTHSGELAVIAVSCDPFPLGIDIEQIRPDRQVLGLIRRFLSPLERQELEHLASERLVEAFHWCWTAKEAYAKALGIGLDIPLDSFDVSVDLAEPAKLLAVRGSTTGRPWTLRRLHVADDYAATLAIAAPACEVRCERWTLGWTSTARTARCM